MQDILDKIAQYADYLKTHKIETYKPYPFQGEFHKAGSEFQYRFLMAGQQIGKCLTKDTVIETTKGLRKIGEIQEDFRVWAWDGEKKVEAKALRPFEKGGLHECYRFVMSDGRWFEAADTHSILTFDGWKHCSDILQQCGPSQRLSMPDTYRKVRSEGAHRYNQKPSGFQAGYQVDCRSGDALLHRGGDNGLVSSPLQSCAQPHSGLVSGLGDLVNICTYILSPSFVRLSIRDAALRFSGRLAGSLVGAWHRYALPTIRKLPGVQRLLFVVVSGLQSVGVTFPVMRGACFSSKLASVISIEGSKIVAVYPIGRNRIYDFSVPEYKNYCTAGVVHHNSVSNLCETTYHLTGLYPDWWEGVRFKRPVDWWLGGQSTKKVRDNLQKKLLGDYEDPASVGTGWIPRECVGKPTRMAGIPGSLDSVKVWHVSGGWSNLAFKTYEQKVEEWMGETMHGISLDEEPPQPIWSQCVIRTLRNKGTVLITATPEQGITEVVRMFMHDKKPGTWYRHASMDDAPHYSKEDIDKALASIPAHERDMRRKGLPMFGRGLVFAVADESISVKPFEIPNHWFRVCAIDFGHDHPFAAVWGAWDRDTDTFYIYDVYRERQVLPPVHARAIAARGTWIPVAWPHDGLNEEKGSGTALSQIYRENGVNLLFDKFTNPPTDGQVEGEGGNKVWPGLVAMNEAMQSGRFKVFSHLSDWFMEKASYHVEADGNLVKKGEDIMAATRYAYMSRRHGITKPIDDADRYGRKKKTTLSWRTA